MKKIIAVTLVTAVCAFSFFAMAAEEKKSSTHETDAKAHATAEHKLLPPSEMQWVDGPPALPAGAKIAHIQGDPKQAGPFTFRLKVPDGFKVPPHTHPSAEHVTVISGSLNLGMGDKFDQTATRELAPGGFAVMPAGMQHFAWMKGETVVQVHGTGPFAINYVNPADDPRNAKK